MLSPHRTLTTERVVAMELRVAMEPICCEQKWEDSVVCSDPSEELRWPFRGIKQKVPSLTHKSWVFITERQTHFQNSDHSNSYQEGILSFCKHPSYLCQGRGSHNASYRRNIMSYDMDHDMDNQWSPTPLPQVPPHHNNFPLLYLTHRGTVYNGMVCVCLLMCLCKRGNATVVLRTVLCSSCCCGLECIAWGGRCGSMHPPTVHWHLFCSFACRQTDRVMGDGRTRSLCCGNKSAATQTPGIKLPG